MDNLVEKARQFAVAAHDAINHKRKYSNDPYWVHPAEVVSILKMVHHTPEMLAAAWLHDVVEDCGVPLSVINEEFGHTVGALVNWVTDVSTASDGNRAQRKAKDRSHSAAAPAEAQSIKMADIISNCKSIIQNDPKFAAVYLEEKRMQLDVMTNGDDKLRKWARSYVGY